MALYTLKSRDEAFAPLRNYSGNSRFVLDQISSANGMPNPAATQVYNALGRTTGAEGNGGDNFFVKRGKSIENALGTTGAAIASGVKSGGILGFKGTENIATENMLKDNKTRMNEIAKKYGYNTYHDVWDARDKAKAEGDTATLDLIDNTINPELQAQANANAKKADEKAANYKDYMENNYVSKKINQDQGKFAGSAINTLSTAVDVTGLGATPLSNAIQGGVEGLADELEQNGFKDFSWERAGQNALIGATTGAVTGALNKGVSGALAKRAAAKGLTDTAVKGGVGTAIKNGAKTLASGAARGALSGAVGGATGAGLQSAMNGVEFGQGVQNALQGAVQGAQQGAVSGGIMAGANAAFGKTNFGKQLQNAKTNWDQSGSNFDERLTNTLTSGDSAVGDWLMNKRQSNVLGAAGNLGNRVQDVSYLSGLKPEELVNAYNRGDISENELANVWHEADKNTRAEIEKYIDSTIPDNQTLASRDLIDEMLQFDKEFNGGNGILENGKKYSKEQAGNALAMAEYNIKNGYFSDPAQAQQALDRINAISNKYDLDEQKTLYGDFITRNNEYWDKSIKLGADDTAGQKALDRKYADVRDGFDAYKQSKSTPTTAKGWAKKAGQRIVEDLNNSNLGNRVKDVNSDMPEDIRNMQINRNDMLGYEDDNTTPLTVDEVLAREGIDPNSTPRPQATTPAALDAWDRVAQEAGYSNYDEVLQRFAEANPDVEINPRGMAGQVLTWMDNNPNTPTTAAGWAKRAGQRLAEDVNNSNLGLRVKDVSTDTAAETPSAVDSRQTELYRALAGKQNSPVEAISESEYGESALANRTKRGMVADALERAGNTLEGAQANVTRAAANDLGIESAGKSIENVRKRTGLTNLETQAAFAKELTGGADSLLDNVQRMALTESADGRPYTVDTSDVAAKVESIVDKYADTNTFGSQNKRNQFISNLRRDISSYDSDVLSIANRMKSNAAAYRGKGVVDPPPADAAKAKIYTEVANELEDLSYKAIPQENVDAMFDTAISEMQDRAAQATANGNKSIAKAYTNSANDLENTPRTVKAYRSFKKDFVDVNKINDLTAKAENGAAVQMGRGFGSGIKRLTGTLLQRPVNAALAKAGGAINTLADKIDGGGEEVVTPQIATPADMAAATANYNPSTQLYNAIGRTEGLTNAEQARTANYLADAAQEAEVVPNTNATNVSSYPDTSATSVYNSLYGTPTATLATAQTSNTNTGYFQPTGDYWTDVIASAMTSAIDADDVTAFATLYDMYQDQLANLQKQASSSQSSTQQKLTATQQRANAAMNSLERLSGMEPDTAYNLSGIPVIGNIATFGGNDYEAEAKSLAQQIGYMVSGSNIKDSEAENIGKSYVPQPWDNEQVRQNKLRRAYEIIQRYQNGYVE